MATRTWTASAGYFGFLSVFFCCSAFEEAAMALVELPTSHHFEQPTASLLPADKVSLPARSYSAPGLFSVATLKLSTAESSHFQMVSSSTDMCFVGIKAGERPRKLSRDRITRGREVRSLPGLPKPRCLPIRAEGARPRFASGSRAHVKCKEEDSCAQREGWSWKEHFHCCSRVGTGKR